MRRRSVAGYVTDEQHKNSQQDALKFTFHFLLSYFFIITNFIPKCYDASVVDEVLDIENDAAIRTAREFSQQEGLLVGISSGCAAYAALLLAQRPENKGKKIVTLLPDTGERYLSTVLYDFDGYSL